MSELPCLPLSIQTFEKMRQDGCLYVDKTRYLADMYKAGGWYFLSRPRRFGKSLTVSTFDAIFSGRRELFAGLAAEEIFDMPKFRPCPVISLDMSDVSTDEDAAAARRSLNFVVNMEARRHKITMENDPGKISPGNALTELIVRAAELGERVVVLIDEYDKPFLDFMYEPKEAEAMRRTMRDFYTKIKAADAYVRFVFITGISKFSRMGVFSAMNNLEDISMNADYAAMLGYTQEELEHYFAPHIEATAAKMGMSPGTLLDKMRAYYDGFSFDGKTMLYNPFSTMQFFKQRDFQNYWFESGTPSFIAKYMKDRHLTVEQFRGIEVSKDFASAPGEIETATAASFLYQAGYLSLRPGKIQAYSLDYPNREVLTSMSYLSMLNIWDGQARAIEANTKLLAALRAGDAEAVVKAFNRLLARIPYDDYSRANAQDFEDEPEHEGMTYGEWLYRSLLLSYVYGAELDVEAEVHGHRGRADIVVKGSPTATLNGRVWVMEFKVARGGDGVSQSRDAEKLADDAMRQIVEMGYAESYDSAVLLSMVIDDAKRSITAFRVRV